jgi:hypothetical protein
MKEKGCLILSTGYTLRLANKIDDVIEDMRNDS